MSGHDTTGGGAQPDGEHTHTGGRHPHHARHGAGGVVTNQTLLPLDGTVFDDLDVDAIQALKVVQIEFARDVAFRAARAYQETLDVINRSAGRQDFEKT